MEQSCSNLEHGLITSRAIYHTCSRSRGQRSRSQRDIIGAQISQIMNNSAWDCSLSIKLTTDYDHVTSDRPQTFKVDGSKVKVMSCHYVLASKNRYILWTDSLTEFKLCANWSHSIAEHVIHVQGHKVKYSNCNNSAADCPISLKFGIDSSFTMAQPAHYNCSRSKGKGQSHRVTVQGHSVR